MLPVALVVAEEDSKVVKTVVRAATWVDQGEMAAARAVAVMVVPSEAAAKALGTQAVAARVAAAMVVAATAVEARVVATVAVVKVVVQGVEMEVAATAVA